MISKNISLTALTFIMLISDCAYAGATGDAGLKASGTFLNTGGANPTCDNTFKQICVEQ